MASGKAHAKASLIAAIPAGLAVGLGLSSILYGIGAALGSILGIALTPDLDQEMTTYFEWKLMKKAGPLAFVWMLIWSPYSLLIPHRSFWSHFPIVGTAIRLLYLSIPIIIFCIWKDCILDLSRIPQVYWNLAWGVLIGLLVSDIIHWIMDM